MSRGNMFEKYTCAQISMQHDTRVSINPTNPPDRISPNPPPYACFLHIILQFGIQTYNACAVCKIIIDCFALGFAC